MEVITLRMEVPKNEDSLRMEIVYLRMEVFKNGVL
jgi:hypothetical protein